MAKHNLIDIFLQEFMDCFGFQPDADILSDTTPLAESLHLNRNDVDQFLQKCTLPRPLAEALLCKNRDNVTDLL